MRGFNNMPYPDASKKKTGQPSIRAQFEDNPYIDQESNNILFSPREIQIIKLISRQYSSKEIAGILHLSPRTVEDHRKNIQKKTNSKNMVGIVVYAIINNIINLQDYL
jgi:DNA-binding CsgD family transcriptional regulator